MPRVIECRDGTECGLAECLQSLDERGFDPQDEGSLTHAALWLRRLGNNRAFLGDLVIDRLKTRHRETDPEGIGYGPQVITLSRPDGAHFMRANIWPSKAEHAYRASGADSFVYGLPHDHNFNFLTLGYFGPGYWSDYFEFDYEALHGFAGERAGLRFVERARLEEGCIQLYRAHADVHAQWPPDTLSVSLNLMHRTPLQGWFDQYVFDTEADVVVRIANPSASEVFLRMAVGLGGETARDLAWHFARHHPCDRMRLAAWDAQAGLLADPAERDMLWRAAEFSGSRMVAMEAKARRIAVDQLSRAT